MCLILFAYKYVPGFRLVLAANRDEFLDRETAPLGYNFADERVIGGKDLQGGGTWLAVAAGGRLGAITNYRDPSQVRSDAPSRGEIILNFLSSQKGAREYLFDLREESCRYNGFNLLLDDGNELLHFSNISKEITTITPGIHGLSNHLLNTPWPKIRRGKELLEKALNVDRPLQRNLIFGLLKDQVQPSVELLPDSGVGLVWERILAPLFIHSERYGTRSSAFVSVCEKGTVEFYERTFEHGKNVETIDEISIQMC